MGNDSAPVTWPCFRAFAVSLKSRCGPAGYEFPNRPLTQPVSVSNIVLSPTYKGGKSMAKENFACVSCGAEAEGDVRTGITECRVCRRMHCDKCVDENGLCVECAKETKK